MRYQPFDRLPILAAAAALTFAALPAPAQEQEQPKPRTVLKTTLHIDAAEATEVLGLLGVHYRIKDDQNLIVLRGESHAIETAIKVIDELDKPRPTIELQVFVLSASKEGSADVPPGLSAAVESLKVFGYEGFKLLDNVLLKVLEGRQGRVDGGVRLGQDEKRTSYRFSFRKATVVPEDGELKIRFKDLRFDVDGPVEGSPLASLKTDVQIREGQTAVIGSSTPRGLAETLILVVKSKASQDPDGAE